MLSFGVQTRFAHSGGSFEEVGFASLGLSFLSAVEFSAGFDSSG